MCDIMIGAELTARGLQQVEDGQGKYWKMTLSDGTILAISFGDEPTQAIGPVDSWDWYVAHRAANGEEIGGGTGNFAIVLTNADDYIREPGWDRGNG